MKETSTYDGPSAIQDAKDKLVLALGAGCTDIPKLSGPSKLQPAGSGIHSRSRSAPPNHSDIENWYLSTPKNFHQEQNDSGSQKARFSLHGKRAALEKDVVELQRRLKYEQAVRYALERAMGRSSWGLSPGHRHLTPQTKELITEITTLEEEVEDLEQHVLSLYRRFFDVATRFSWPSSPFSARRRTWTQRAHTEGSCFQNQDQSKIMSSLDTVSEGIHSKQSSSFNTSVINQAGSGIAKIKASFTRPGQPVAFEEPATDINSAKTQFSYSQKFVKSKVTRERYSRGHLNSFKEEPRPLREYLSETPNKLSEELVRCMASIYCKLSDPPLLHLGVPDSPSSCTSSSTSLSSAQGIHSDGWSPGWKNDKMYDTLLVDPFQVKGKGKAGLAGAYSSMVEVPWISVDKERLSHATRMLREFRSMVEQLEKVDPSQLTHDEKLAFWINVYNALLMHAYLAYGIPRNNLKRMTLLQRAAYRIGGHSINAQTIENSILGCRLHRPSQWLQNFLSPGSKLKASDERRSFAIETPEPTVSFALSCGGRSDPAVRVYTAKNVHSELECSKREYLQASIGFLTDKKVLLPKIVEWYARESAIPSNNIFDWVSQYLEDREKVTMLKCMMRSKSQKSTSHCIEWIPYNFSFRYLFDPELATRFVSSTRTQLH